VRQIYRFGRFALDATAKVLLRDGEPVRLSRKAAETLLALVEHPGQVLTKDELIRAIWQGRVVDEANLIQNIAVVRRTLGLSPGQPGYIETFPGRGYRMLGPILAEEEEPHRPQRVAAPDTHPPETPQPGPGAQASPAIPQSATRIRHKRIAFILSIVAMAAAIPVVWWFTRNPGETQRQLPFRRMAVARLGGKEFQPAISPDGAKIAFVLEREDGTPDRIWLRSGQTPPVTIEREGWQCLSPAWSPDAKSLAYLRLSGDEGQVMIASAATGKDERVVTEVFRTRYGLPNHHLDWSPDGKTLAFDDTSAPEKPFAISIISLETGNRMQLTIPPSNALGDVEPRFSPDGGSLSFIRVFHRARQGLFTIELGNRKLRQLSRDGFQISGQDWLPDGKSIVMGSNRSGDFRLWRVRAGDSGAEPVPDSTGTYGDAALQLSIARRAPVLVYSVLQEDFNIWRLNLQAGENGPDRWTRVVNSSAQDVSTPILARRYTDLLSLGPNRRRAALDLIGRWLESAAGDSGDSASLRRTLGAEWQRNRIQRFKGAGPIYNQTPRGGFLAGDASRSERHSPGLFFGREMDLRRIFRQYHSRAGGGWKPDRRIQNKGTFARSVGRWQLTILCA
jgi:DNA-binding winged helix-turn-helix (wHTH) protein